jgi:flagellin
LFARQKFPSPGKICRANLAGNFWPPVPHHDERRVTVRKSAGNRSFAVVEILRTKRARFSGTALAIRTVGAKRFQAKRRQPTRTGIPMLSVNTNYGAMIALQSLNATNKELDEVQNRVNTGFRISGPKDNGAIFAVAQAMRADVQAFTAVSNSLNRSISVVDTGIAAGTSVSDLLKEMKEKALAAKDATIDANSRAAYNADFVALRDQITKTLANAVFDGSNVVTSTTSNLQALANADGTSFVTATGRNLSLGGSIVTIAAAGNISTAAAASTMITTIETSLNNLNLALAQLGTDSKKLGIHKSFVAKLSDELTNGIGNLVNADLATESARLTALQTKQQLGVQALSIANQGPQILLSLFR